LDLKDGDVCTFDTATMWHCCVQVPLSLGDCCIFSLYYKGSQRKAFEKALLDPVHSTGYLMDCTEI
jgi:hypothetical protein